MPLSRNSGCKGTIFQSKNKNNRQNIFGFHRICVILEHGIEENCSFCKYRLMPLSFNSLTNESTSKAFLPNLLNSEQSNISTLLALQ